MNCPKCTGRTAVNMTRQVERGTLRWRVCADCGHKFYSLQDPQRLIPGWAITWTSGVPTIDHQAVARLEGRQ